MSIYDAAMKYKAEGMPLVVLAGAEYGTRLQPRLGRQGHVAAGRAGRDRRSFERIHRSNLVGMGVLPLEFARAQPGNRSASPAKRSSTSSASTTTLKPRQQAEGRRHDRPTASANEFPATVRIDTPVELDYYRNGGILQTVLRKLLRSS